MKVQLGLGVSTLAQNRVLVRSVSLFVTCCRAERKEVGLERLLRDEDEVYGVWRIVEHWVSVLNCIMMLFSNPHI